MLLFVVWMLLFVVWGLLSVSIGSWSLPNRQAAFFAFAAAVIVIPKCLYPVSVAAAVIIA
jgi:hypothetical protein